MKRYSTLFLLFLSLACLLGAEELENLAVLDFKAKGVDAEQASVITDIIRGYFVKTNKYTVLDRTHIESLLAEQSFQQSGKTDTQRYVEIGKLLNVHYIVVGTLSTFGNLYLLSTEMINVQTGKIMQSETGQSSSLEEIISIGKSIVEKLTGTAINAEIIGSSAQEQVASRDTSSRYLERRESVPSQVPQGWRGFSHPQTGCRIYFPPNWIEQIPRNSPGTIMEFRRPETTDYAVAVSYTQAARRLSRSELVQMLSELSKGEQLLARCQKSNTTNTAYYSQLIAEFRGYSEGARVKSVIRIISTDTGVYVLIGAMPVNGIAMEWNNIYSVLMNFSP